MPTILESITSSSMRQRLEELRAQHAGIQVLYYMLGPERILEWLHSVGVCTDDFLKSLAPNTPPLELRSIVAAPELEIFLWTGLVDICNFLELYQNQKHPEDPGLPNVFDFGCGCGRLTRFLNDSEKFNVFASDINSDHVQWCQDNLIEITTRVNGTRPPLPFADAFINFAYSMSIFTHLPEEVASLWLDDMGRVLAPHGILIITTHGETALNVIKSSKIHQVMFKMDENSTQSILDNLKHRPFQFLSYSNDVLAAAKAGDDYGNSFIHHDYIHNHWNNEQFRVLDYIAGGLRGWQDIVVLQRRGF